MGSEQWTVKTLELASTVFGSIGLLLFFLPILGIPISSGGLALGFASFLGAAFSGSSLKWSAVGIAVCSLALAINLAIAFAPAGSMNNRPAIELWPTEPNQPYVPPPAPVQT